VDRALERGGPAGPRLVDGIPPLGGWRAGNVAPHRVPVEHYTDEDGRRESFAAETATTPLSTSRQSRKAVWLVGAFLGLLFLTGTGLLALNDVGTHRALSAERYSSAAMSKSLTSSQRQLDLIEGEANTLRQQLSAALKQAASAEAAEVREENDVAAQEELYAAEDRYAECITNPAVAKASCPTNGLSTTEVQQLQHQILDR